MADFLVGMCWARIKKEGHRHRNYHVNNQYPTSAVCLKITLEFSVINTRLLELHKSGKKYKVRCTDYSYEAKTPMGDCKGHAT